MDISSHIMNIRMVETRFMETPPFCLLFLSVSFAGAAVNPNPKKIFERVLFLRL